ncbi:MAG: hypothetical protein KDC26_11495 [Armatimonadetes bacterium]|nr:hypothetical protein [Armatimonadota bacterium]
MTKTSLGVMACGVLVLGAMALVKPAIGQSNQGDQVPGQNQPPRGGGFGGVAPQQPGQGMPPMGMMMGGARCDQVVNDGDFLYAFYGSEVFKISKESLKVAAIGVVPAGARGGSGVGSNFGGPGVSPPPARVGGGGGEESGAENEATKTVD